MDEKRLYEALDRRRDVIDEVMRPEDKKHAEDIIAFAQKKIDALREMNRTLAQMHMSLVGAEFDEAAHKLAKAREELDKAFTELVRVRDKIDSNLKRHVYGY